VRFCSRRCRQAAFRLRRRSGVDAARSARTRQRVGDAGVGNELVDLFPGTGVVTRAWTELSLAAAVVSDASAGSGRRIAQVLSDASSGPGPAAALAEAR